MWVCSLVGLAGKSVADIAAKAAILPVSDLTLPYLGQWHLFTDDFQCMVLVDLSMTTPFPIKIQCTSVSI